MLTFSHLISRSESVLGDSHDRHAPRVAEDIQLLFRCVGCSSMWFRSVFKLTVTDGGATVWISLHPGL